MPEKGFYAAVVKLFALVVCCQGDRVPVNISFRNYFQLKSASIFTLQSSVFLPSVIKADHRYIHRIVCGEFSEILGKMINENQDKSVLLIRGEKGGF